MGKGVVRVGKEAIGVGEEDVGVGGACTPGWVRGAAAGLGSNHGCVGVGQGARVEEIKMGRRK